MCFSVPSTSQTMPNNHPANTATVNPASTDNTNNTVNPSHLITREIGTQYLSSAEVLSLLDL